MEIETLATREDGFRNLLRIGGTENEHHMAGRFFDGFQKCIEGRRREHVNLVDDVNLPSTSGWSVAYAADDFLAHVFDARAACRVELVHIRVSALRNGLAFRARTVGLDGGALFAHQRLGEDARRGGFASSSWTAEQVCMGDFILLDSVFQRALNMLLTHNVGKSGRTIFAVQRLHAWPPLRKAQRFRITSA